MQPPPPVLSPVTLVGILSRLQGGGSGAPDPDLGARVAAAFASHDRSVRALVATGLPGLPGGQVEEAVQEVFATAWAQGLHERGGDALAAGLAAAAMRTCVALRGRRGAASQAERPALPSETLLGVLSRIQAGDRGQDDPELRGRIDAAFAKHHRRLQGLVASELRGFSPQQVEDTVQEVFATAWRRLPEHDGRSFKAWLFEIATRTCANVRRKRRDALPGDDALFDAASDVESAYGVLRREERESLLRDAARAVLTPQEQDIVHMRYELDLPRDEIARLAGLPDPDAVRVALQRSKRVLTAEIRRRLRELGHGDSLLADPD